MNSTLGFFLGSTIIFGVLVFIVGQPVNLAPPTERQLDVSRTSATAARQIMIPDPRRRVGATTEIPEESIARRADAMSVPLPAPVRAAGVQDGPSERSLSLPDSEPVALTNQGLNELALAEEFLRQSAVVDSQPESVVQAAASPDVESPEVAATPAASIGLDLEWYPLWDPFHSELSAKAFARRLETVTGLDYRVFKIDAEGYRVTVGYQSEEQRMINVAKIEEATGLSLAGGRL